MHELDGADVVLSGIFSIQNIVNSIYLSGKGYLTTGKSDVKKFLTKKRQGSGRTLSKENSVSD